jgi:hypothetical protein
MSVVSVTTSVVRGRGWLCYLRENTNRVLTMRHPTKFPQGTHGLP